MTKLSNWEDLPEDVRNWMKFLGEFGPTTLAEDKTIKGSMADHEEGGCCKTYLSSDDVRDLAISCLTVAKWLDQRAKVQP